MCKILHPEAPGVLPENAHVASGREARAVQEPCTRARFRASGGAQKGSPAVIFRHGVLRKHCHICLSAPGGTERCHQEEGAAHSVLLCFHFPRLCSRPCFGQERGCRHASSCFCVLPRHCRFRLAAFGLRAEAVRKNIAFLLVPRAAKVNLLSTSLRASP